MLDDGGTAGPEELPSIGLDVTACDILAADATSSLRCGTVMQRARIGGIAAAATLAAAGLVVTGSNATPADFHFDQCPKAGTLAQSPQTIEEVVAAARALIPHVFAGINNAQGRNPPVTKANTNITEVLALFHSTIQATRYRKAAAKSCGSRVAYRSWAVLAQFPDMQMAGYSQLAAFLVKTTSGWRLYSSVWDPR